MHFSSGDHFINSHDIFSRWCMDSVRRKLMLVILLLRHLDTSKFNVLYNSALRFHERLYAALDVDLCRVRLHEPLEVIVQNPLLYVRDLVPKPCFEALAKLDQVRSGKTTDYWALGVTHLILGSLSGNVFERRTSTGSGLFSFFEGGLAQIFSQIASITVKKLRNTNFISSRHVKRENTSLPVDVRRSKTSLLKLPIVAKYLLNSSCTIM